MQNKNGDICVSRASDSTAVSVATIPPSVPAPVAWGACRTINGIEVCGKMTGGIGTYIAPSLGVELYFTGTEAQKVFHTLTWSPRAVAVASGSAPSTPSSWRTTSFDGVSFSVPGQWKTHHASLDLLGCVPAWFDHGYSDEVVFNTDRRVQEPGCPLWGWGVVADNAGVQVDGGPDAQTIGRAYTYDSCTERRGLRICQSTYAYSFLILRVTVPGRPKPVYFSIGLAGNGMVARTILYSLRAA